MATGGRWAPLASTQLALQAGGSRSWWAQQAAEAEELCFQAIDPLVSRRLVTCREERDAVMAEAATSTGLHCLLPLFVPCACVETSDNARWLAQPGRYNVTRKADGQRHLLIVLGNGATYLLNRAGALYSYPMAAGGAQDPGAAAGVQDPGTAAGVQYPAAAAGAQAPGTEAGAQDPAAVAGGQDPGAAAGSQDPEAAIEVWDPGAAAGA